MPYHLNISSNSTSFYNFQLLQTHSSNNICRRLALEISVRDIFRRSVLVPLRSKIGDILRTYLHVIMPREYQCP